MLCACEGTLNAMSHAPPSNGASIPTSLREGETDTCHYRVQRGEHLQLYYCTLRHAGQPCMQTPRRLREPICSTVRPGYVLCTIMHATASPGAKMLNRTSGMYGGATGRRIRTRTPTYAWCDTHDALHVRQYYHKIWVHMCRTCSRIYTSPIRTNMHTPTLMDTVNKVVRIAFREYGIGALRFHVFRWRMCTGAA